MTKENIPLGEHGTKPTKKYKVTFIIESTNLGLKSGFKLEGDTAISDWLMSVDNAMRGEFISLEIKDLLD